jgi:toxin secretion/phage lysis holin
MIDNWFKWLSGFIGAVVGYLYGGWTGPLIALIYLVGIDYISGTLAAGVNGNLNSKKGFQGAAKKVMIFLVVGMAHILDGILNQNVLMSGAIFLFISGEVISIGENATTLGMPLPDFLMNAISKKGGGPFGQ